MLRRACGWVKPHFCVAAASLFPSTPTLIASHEASSSGCMAPHPLCCSMRYVASRRAVRSYPLPSKNRQKKTRKAFNYLTNDRLIERAPALKRGEVRKRDNIKLKQYHLFKENTLKQIDEKVKYFPPFVSDYVFFAAEGANGRRKVFKTSRQLFTRVYIRVYVMVLQNFLKGGAQREELVRLMEEANVTIPSPAMWRRFTDSKTGNISVGLLHSAAIRAVLTSLFKKRAQGRQDDCTTTEMYVARYLLDESKVPSLERWWAALGPLHPNELAVSGRMMGKKKLKAEGDLQVTEYGIAEVHAAVKGMNPGEVDQLSSYFHKHAEGIFALLQTHHVFSLSIQMALNSLTEILVIQSSRKAYLHHQQCDAYLRQHGAYYPQPRHLRSWGEATAEERKRFTPFDETGAERGSRSGLMLFFRCCSVDYGLTKREASFKASELSDLQMAALDFPFHLHLSAAEHAKAFTRFRRAQCKAYGLVREPSYPMYNNLLFKMAMRMKWMDMTAAERQPYEDDEMGSAFPLLPSKGPGGGAYH